jgi:hypothetical protein
LERVWLKTCSHWLNAWMQIAAICTLPCARIHTSTVGDELGVRSTLGLPWVSVARRALSRTHIPLYLVLLILHSYFTLILRMVPLTRLNAPASHLPLLFAFCFTDAEVAGLTDQAWADPGGRTCGKRGFGLALVFFARHPIFGSIPCRAVEQPPENRENNGRRTRHHLQRVSTTSREGKPLGTPTWQRYVLDPGDVTRLRPARRDRVETHTRSVTLHTPNVRRLWREVLIGLSSVRRGQVSRRGKSHPPRVLLPSPCYPCTYAAIQHPGGEEVIFAEAGQYTY